MTNDEWPEELYVDPAEIDFSDVDADSGNAEWYATVEHVELDETDLMLLRWIEEG